MLLSSGRIAFGLYSVSAVEALAKDGKMKEIAGAAAGSNNTFPNAESIAKTLPCFDFLGWFMVVVPKGTPEPTIAGMHKAITTAIRHTAVIAMAPKLGFDLYPNGIGSHEDASKFLAAQLDLWSKTTKDLGLQPE